MHDTVLGSLAADTSKCPRRIVDERKGKKKKEKKEKKVIFLLLSLHLDPCYSRVRSEIEMGGKRIFSFSLDRLPSLRAMAPVH